MAHLSVGHVLARTHVRTHTHMHVDPSLRIHVRTQSHTHVDPGLDKVSTLEYPSSRGLVKITSWSTPPVVSLWGVINAFYAIITLAFSIN